MGLFAKFVQASDDNDSGSAFAEGIGGVVAFAVVCYVIYKCCCKDSSSYESTLTDEEKKEKARIKHNKKIDREISKLHVKPGHFPGDIEQQIKALDAQRDNDSCCVM